MDTISKESRNGVVKMALPDEIEQMFISACSANGTHVLSVYQQASASYMPHVVASIKNEFMKRLLNLPYNKEITVTTIPLNSIIQSKLSVYPDVRKFYEKAMNGFDKGVDCRHAMDDLRLSLETLLKSVLENDKSLENQCESLCAYLGAKGISSEIVGNVRVNLTAISRYFNEHEKHKDNVKLNEMDYIVTAVNNIMSILL